MNKCYWFVCEYQGNGAWKPISKHCDYFCAKKECNRLFDERGGKYSKLPSIAVIDDSYLAEIGMLELGLSMLCN